MKKSCILLFCSLFTFHCSLSAQHYGWVDISKKLPDLPFDTTYNNSGDTLVADLTDLYFINDDEGWVTSWQQSDTATATIFHTVDGGDSWEMQRVDYSCNDIWMLDSQTGYAGSQAGGIIYKTTDGGMHWNFYGITGRPVTDMSFPPGSDTGYVCSDQCNTFHKIRPEGLIEYSATSNNFWEGISGTSEGVWMAGGVHVNFWNGTEWEWDAPGLCSYYTCLYFISDRNGWVGNHCFVQGFNRHGIPWTKIFDTEEASVISIHALTKDQLWATLFDGRIIHTENASDYSWDTITHLPINNVVWETQPHPPVKGLLRSIQFTSPNNGYVVGNENVILKYTEVLGIGKELQNTPAIELYPNPTRGKFQILNLRHQTIPKLQTQKTEVVDLYGKVLIKFNCQLPAANCQLDISHLPAGLYILKISTLGSSIVRKVIKQ